MQGKYGFLLRVTFKCDHADQMNVTLFGNKHGMFVLLKVLEFEQTSGAISHLYLPINNKFVS